MNTNENPRRRGDTGGDERSEAVRRADAGVAAWRAAAHAQPRAVPDHGEFYELAGFLVETLRALHAFAVVLAEQVEGYPDRLEEGLAVYDDSGVVDPRDRLVTAAVHARYVPQALAQAEVDAQAFWSAIGHIGTEGVTR